MRGQWWDGVGKESSLSLNKILGAIGPWKGTREGKQY